MPRKPIEESSEEVSEEEGSEEASEDPSEGESQEGSQEDSEEGSEEKSDEASQVEESGSEEESEELQSDVEEQPNPSYRRRDTFNPGPTGLDLIKCISLELDDLSNEIDSIFSYFKEPEIPYSKSQSKESFGYTEDQIPEAPKSLSYPKPSRRQLTEETPIESLYKHQTPSDEPISLVKETRPKEFFSFKGQYKPYY